MRKQEDTSGRDQTADAPGGRAKAPIEPRQCRGYRANVHRMPGRKSIVGLAGTRDSPTDTPDVAVGPPLVHEALKKMRQEGADGGIRGEIGSGSAVPR